MDRACEGDKTRGLVETLGMMPVVPPKANRKIERDCDRELCKLRNEVERLFRRLRTCRRIHTQFDKRHDVSGLPAFRCRRRNEMRFSINRP